MEWTFADDEEPPEGGEKKFTAGTLRGQTYLDITLDHPDQYFTTYRSKTLSEEAKAYVQWVQRHFAVDTEAKQLTPKRHQAEKGSPTCQHTKVHHKGSSARYLKTTCMQCGLVSTEERDPDTVDPEVCPHAHTDHRGSNKYVKKTFCKDCKTYIDTVSQEIAKSTKDETPWLTTEEESLLERVGEHDTINRAQIIKAAELMIAESRELENGEYKLVAIGNMFIDCCDRVLTTPEAERTAMMYAQGHFGKEITSPKAAETKWHKDCCTMKLRVVDPIKDEHVWPMVDECCNSCTHGEHWRKDAERKWAKLGFAPYLKDSTGTHFSGVGENTSSGKWKFPMSFQLQESGEVLPGGADSHEMPKTWHPMLISQAAQAKLGFIKNSRTGTICMEDYNMQTIEVVRHAKTGLFMVRIDHLHPHMYARFPPSLSNLLIKDNKLPLRDVSMSDDERERCGYVANEQRAKKEPYRPERCGKPCSTEIFDAGTVVVSCGLSKFEESNYSEGRSTEYKEWQESNEIVIRKYNLSDFPIGREKFIRSFRANYPTLSRDRNLVIIDCTSFRNPDEDRSLRSHIGRHYETVKGVVTSKNFQKINQPLEYLRSGQKNVVICVCVKGKHRSVADSEAITEPIHSILYDKRQGAVRTVDLQAETHWRDLCAINCRSCDVNDRDHIREMLPVRHKAFQDLQAIIPKGKRPLIPLPPPKAISGAAPPKSMPVEPKAMPKSEPKSPPAKAPVKKSVTKTDRRELRWPSWRRDQSRGDEKERPGKKKKNCSEEGTSRW